MSGETQAERALREAEMRGYAAYLSACEASGTDPREWEQRALSIGSEFLPPCALVVREGGDPSREYWVWLTAQLGVES